MSIAPFNRYKCSLNLLLLGVLHSKNSPKRVSQFDVGLSLRTPRYCSKIRTLSTYIRKPLVVSINYQSSSKEPFCVKFERNTLFREVLYIYIYICIYYGICNIQQWCVLMYNIMEMFDHTMLNNEYYR